MSKTGYALGKMPEPQNGEEVKGRLRHSREVLRKDFGDLFGRTTFDFALEYIEMLESAQPKWISVEDDQPEAGKTVQLLWKRASDKVQSVCGYMLPHNDIAIAYRFHIFDYNIYAWEDVTHWAPLLEPPKEEA